MKTPPESKIPERLAHILDAFFAILDENDTTKGNILLEKLEPYLETPNNVPPKTLEKIEAAVKKSSASHPPTGDRAIRNKP